MREVLSKQSKELETINVETCSSITNGPNNRARTNTGILDTERGVLLAPSKTFNIAGLGGSFAIIPNPNIRKRFKEASFGIMPHMSSFAAQTVLAAYQYGEPWRKELIAYLKSNHDFLLAEVNKIPSLSMVPLQATYLTWIHCSRMDIPNLEAYLLKFGLGVSGGQQFKSKGYFRLNFGTQRARLEKAVELLKNAFAEMMFDNQNLKQTIK